MACWCGPTSSPAGWVRYTEHTDERAALDRLTELFEDEPAIIEPPRAPYGKPVRPGQEQRFPHMTDRYEKRLARQKRG